MIHSCGESACLLCAYDAGEDFLDLECGIVFLAREEANITAAAIFIGPFFAEIFEETCAAAGSTLCEIGHLVHLRLRHFCSGDVRGTFKEAKVADEVSA